MDKYYLYDIVFRLLKFVAILTACLFLAGLMSEIMPEPRQDWGKEIARLAAIEAYQRENRLLDAPHDACAESAEIIKSGEMYWCFSRMKGDWRINSDDSHFYGYDCEIDTDTCVSPNQPGTRIGYQGWLNEYGQWQVVEYFEVVDDGSVIECKIDADLCSDEDMFYFGAQLCVDYHDCEPATSHANSHRSRRRGKK